VTTEQLLKETCNLALQDEIFYLEKAEQHLEDQAQQSLQRRARPEEPALYCCKTRLPEELKDLQHQQSSVLSVIRRLL